MKVPILNKKLTSERVYGIRLPFPPIALPAHLGCISDPEHATDTHYATVVLVIDENNSPAILEFSQEVMDALLAYASRHRGLSNIEILLSRDNDSNELRIRVGETFDGDDVQILASAYTNIYDGLYAKYMTRLGKELNDIT